MAVDVGSGVFVGAGVLVLVGIKVLVGVLVAVGEGVIVGVLVAVGVEVRVGVRVGVLVCVGVGRVRGAAPRVILQAESLKVTENPKLLGAKLNGALLNVPSKPPSQSMVSVLEPFAA